MLLLFSLVFYAWGEPLYILLMFFSVFVNYLFAIGIENRQEKGCNAKFILVLAAVVNLGLISIYKYADFFSGIIGSITGLDIPKLHLPLPIGISFYTFQILSYVIDVYRKDVKAQRNIFYLGAYLSSFTHLVAGPIVRYRTIEHELVNRIENIDEFAYGIRRFVVGLSKKVLIADNMAVVADAIFAKSAGEYGALGAWIAVFAYTMQIYFDFSGYSDMAIGLGRMMGFHFLENFNYPYIAKSVTDFWRRWHISLSTFFRDYVYIPLGGNRVGKSRLVFNIMIVWLLTGLWHGASYNFVLWGVYYGVLLLIEKFVLGKHIEKLPSIIGHIYTIIIFMFGWVIFRAESLSQIGEIFGALFGRNGTSNLDFLVYTQVLTVKNIIVAIAALVASTPIFHILYKRCEKTWAGRIFTDVSIMVLFIICILLLGVGSYSPFIYFRF